MVGAQFDATLTWDLLSIEDVLSNFGLLKHLGNLYFDSYNIGGGGENFGN